MFFAKTHMFIVGAAGGTKPYEIVALPIGERPSSPNAKNLTLLSEVFAFPGFGF